ncbi:hypothetical protein P170DRAFT_507996 [Aspergillus steynii IBT 23096]|uniref:Putative gamma-glutamylcyclotransferase n=1 Tax=Aspergillus steynii IBT 23096 TaxID=1392250 RepID=A0A2I2GKD7_9EURO|nr:uncharacterized protein P170DRAFT_507996 [Aspergillus steynii IBT 23096]PLB53348.1 hypothetical protein P170DRAFT_507996 [Aspergillus steynii IBT 23096]
MSTRPMPLMMGKPRAQNASEATSIRTLTACDRYTETDKPEDLFQRQWCFVYGTLIDHDTLCRVLKLTKSHTPLVMRRARVSGYEIKMWGTYPALVVRELNTIDGMAWEVLSQRQLDRLAAYQTDKYCLRRCMIELLNDDGSVGKRVEGLTFV